MSERRELKDGSGRTALVDGSVVGGYTVTYLASGGMSCVYRTERDGKILVLKEVDASNTREVPSLISEKGLLERLDHPGVVGFRSFFNEGGYYYLVLDHVPGTDLSRFLTESNQADPETVADWGVQLCDIFSYLHAQSPPVIYRDLKAENILLQDGEIRLIDFGIARLHKGARAKDTELMGSPATASPEHYGGAETDARSDIFTIGATLYELITGGKRKQIGAFQFAPVRELNDKVSPGIEKVLAKATAFKPINRYQSAIEMRDALLRALGRPIPESKFPSEGKKPTHSGSTGKPKTYLLVPLLLLAVIGLLGWQAYKQNMSPKAPIAESGVGSLSSYEANLEADIFTSGEVDGHFAVLLGEEIGLFQVAGWADQDEIARARYLTELLNTRYHTACSSCGGTALEPQDVKIGRHLETDQVVVFYAHQHGPETGWEPELLTTITESQARALSVTPRFVAAYWRDLIRDTLNISRGVNVPDSVMGPELSRALLNARPKLLEDTEQLTALRPVVSELSGNDSLNLRELFLQIPDKKLTSDRFEELKGYAPLTI